MDFKEGVEIGRLQPQTLLALLEAEKIYKGRLLNMTVTSVNDGEHMWGSLHYKGLAADLRTKGTGLARQLAQDIKKKLGPLGFDVVLEYEGDSNEHIHLEYDPK